MQDTAIIAPAEKASAQEEQRRNQPHSKSTQYAGDNLDESGKLAEEKSFRRTKSLFAQRQRDT